MLRIYMLDTFEILELLKFCNSCLFEMRGFRIKEMTVIIAVLKTDQISLFIAFVQENAGICLCYAVMLNFFKLVISILLRRALENEVLTFHSVLLRNLLYSNDFGI